MSLGRHYSGLTARCGRVPRTIGLDGDDDDVKTIPIPAEGDVISGKYRLEEVLGRGGFGIVFRATHLEMDRSVALKTLLPQSLGDVAAADRFRREAVLASSLTHPNSITLFDYGQTEDGLLYLVMELLRGQTLKHYLRDTGVVDPARARNITVQVLKSLSEAHDLGIVHLDLKPENIFLCDVPGEQDFVKVLDFGVARMLADVNVKEDLSASLAFGTPKYMSPEQITGEPVGPATDIYSLGLIAWEMLMGEPAFHGRTPLEIVAKQVNNAVPDLAEPLASSPLGRVVQRAISKRPDDRFAKASEALDLLQTENPMSIDAGWLDDDLLGGGDLGDGFLPVEGWPSVENLDPAEIATEAALYEMAQDDEPDHALEAELTSVVQRGQAVHSYLEEGTLGSDVGEDPMNAEATVVAGHFEDSPTEAIMLLREADVEVVTEDEEFESEPTSLYTGRLSGEYASNHPRHYEALSTNHAVAVEGEGTDPAAIDSNSADPVDGAGRSVLFSVGQEAGYIGAAHNVPGVHIPPGADLASLDRHARQPAGPTNGVANGVHYQHPVRVVHPTGEYAAYPPPGIDRGIVLALSLLGLGLMAILTLVIVVLMLPILRGQSSLTSPQPVAVQSPQPPVEPVADPITPVAPPSVAPVPVAAQPDVGTPDVAVAAVDAVDVGSAQADVPAAPAEWALTLTSTPAGAEVVVGDEVIGKTPVVVQRTAVGGKLAGTLRLEGYLDHEFVADYTGPNTFEYSLEKKRKPVVAAANTGRKAPSVRPRTEKKTVIRGKTGPKTTPKKSGTRPPMGKGKSTGKNPWGKW